MRDSQANGNFASQSLHLRMLQLNCYACHERAKRGGIGPQRRGYFETVGHVDLGDEGRLPPPLDGVGRKLTEAWFKKVFAGSGDIRPHMHVRMPVFAATSVASLPAIFETTDSVVSTPPAKALLQSKEHAEAGRLLLDLGCVQCHPMRGEHLPGVVGVDLAGIASRVHALWFRDFLLDPAQLKSRTRMPTFFPNGRSTVPSILDGDVASQIAAIWTYLKDVDRQPLPEKLAASKVHNFELVPEERPILLRTFMQRVGTQAIAVGFPAKVHVAFDAESIRLAQAWRGRFIDAHGTWFDRFTPPAVPLGHDIVSFPDGVPFALLAAAQESWPVALSEANGYRFRGYRLDSHGVPTFLYRFDQIEVEDRFEPTSDQQLMRKLRLSAAKSFAGERVVWFRANTGERLQLLNETTCVNEAGLSTSVSSDASRPGELRNNDNNAVQWIIPIDLQQRATIEVKYKW